MKTDYKMPSFEKTRVLIFGGLGFIGSNLAHKCLALGAEVGVFDCLDPNSGGNAQNINGIEDRLDIHYQDIRDFGEVAKAVTKKDLIINCASSTSHPFSMREPLVDLDINGLGVINVLEAIRRYNRAAKLVHLGTSTQLGRLQYQPADEKHPEFPTDIYSANKSVSEKYVLIYANAYQLRACTIRLSNVFGPRATIHSPEFTFNNYFIGLALQGRAITVYGDGRQLRNVIYVEDAVDAILLASASEHVNGQTLFAVGDDHYSVAEIAAQTVRAMGSGRVEHVDWPAGRKAIDVGDAVLSNSRIKEILGWQPRHDLAAGLAKTRDYYRGCLDKYLR